MSTVAIQVERVYKKFRRGERHGSLRDAIGAWIGRRRPSSALLSDAEFWALDNVDFTVRRGEALGIIGPNGAGKSTVLKLLAGILRPNRGCVRIEGRVSALIEVGAGFHPDLTGRENIFLNAAILGMSRAEARSKFDDIVDFAGIADFLDTPIKRYSSGMYARLGFSVAAHVEPDVLLVDEVLSVGDRAFRARCMAKMRAFRKQGVAIVFVSHDLNAVASFCDRAMVLSAGRTLFCGGAPEAVARYHAAHVDQWMLPEARTGSLVAVDGMQLLDGHGRPSCSFTPGDEMIVEYDARFATEMPDPSFGLSLLRLSDHVFVFETSSTRMRVHASPATRGSVHRVRYRVRLNVPPGEYAVGYHVRDREAKLYAAMRAEERRLMVLGEAISGGTADLAPHVEVEAVAPSAALDGLPA